MTQPSLAALNTELAGRGAELVVEDRRFRPNITVEGEFPAWAEDTWAWVRVGEATFRNVKPCTRCDLHFSGPAWCRLYRCVYTTVDPVTGEKDPAGEPLATLRTFRSSLDPEERSALSTVW